MRATEKTNKNQKQKRQTTNHTHTHRHAQISRNFGNMIMITFDCVSLCVWAEFRVCQVVVRVFFFHSIYSIYIFFLFSFLVKQCAREKDRARANVPEIVRACMNWLVWFIMSGFSFFFSWSCMNIKQRLDRRNDGRWPPNRAHFVVLFNTMSIQTQTHKHATMHPPPVQIQNMRLSHTGILKEHTHESRTSDHNKEISMVSLPYPKQQIKKCSEMKNWCHFHSFIYGFNFVAVLPFMNTSLSIYI